MAEFLAQINHWHWLAFGGFLLLSELLGGAGYLLWLGISAASVGTLMTVYPTINWEHQWLTFGLVSLFATWGWWYYQHKKDALADSDRVLNQKKNQLLGTELCLTSAITQRKGRITLGGSTWLAHAQSDIKAGTVVRIIKVEGIVVTVAPVSTKEEMPAN